MIVLAIFLIIFSCMDAIAAPARPFEREASKYEAMLFEGKYQDIEALAEQYLKTHTAITDGQPALAALHGGVSGCLSNGCTDYLTDEQWKLKLDHLKKWNSQFPNSNTGKVALASYYMEYAWHARGQGYANSVTEEGWKNFHMYIDRSRVELEAVSEQGKSDPRWFDSILMIGLAQKWPKEKLEKIYKEGIKKYHLYLPLYFNRSAYLAPRWYGSNKELREYVEEAVLATRNELGETLYARLNWSLQTENMFTNGQADWNRMKMGFERMTKDYPDPWNINSYAKFACMAQDWDTLNALSKEVKKRPVIAAWSNSQSYFEQCLNYAEFMVNKSIQTTTGASAD